MVIVTGTIVGREDTIDELIELSLEHVHRSRTETGCITHGVHRDVENPLRLFFYEEWADRDALHAHFAVPASNDFVKAAAGLADGDPAISINDTID